MEADQTKLFSRDLSSAEVSLSKKSKAGKFVSSVWSFPDSDGNALYRWYGTLPKPLVKRVLELYSPRNVLDPFAGLGTTLEVAADLGIKAKGYDSNPLACLATEARVYGIASKDSLSSSIARISTRLGGSLGGPSSSTSSSTDEFFANEKYRYTRKWFRKDSLSALLSLFLEIGDVEQEDVQRLLFVSGAQTVREVASVDPRCTHHLVTKSKPFIDPVPIFVQATETALKAVRNRPASSANIQISQGSILKQEAKPGKHDFVLVHPPYLGMIHYHLIHRLATDVLDFVKASLDPPSLKGYEFSYDSIKKDDVSTDNTAEYKEFIERLGPIIDNVLKDGGRCAVIIGDQRYHGHLRHPAIDFVNELERNHMTLEEMFIWVLQNNAGMHILRRGHFIDHNYIQIFHKTS